MFREIILKVMLFLAYHYIPKDYMHREETCASLIKPIKKELSES